MENKLTAVQNIKINQRNISYRKVGNGKRKILFFHGFPGSSAQIEPFLGFIQDFDLEVLSIDRPGYNQTELSQGAQFAQTNEACRQIVDAVGWSSCELIAVSGGTPFLFSFLQAYPHFVSRVSVVCGLGPIIPPGFQDLLTWKAKLALRILPFVPGFAISLIFSNNKVAIRNSRFDIIDYFLPPSPADIKTMQNLKVQNILKQAVLEAFRQNGKGPKLDAKSFLLNWKLNVAEYSGPIHFWHGDNDNVIPLAMAQKMSLETARSELNILNGEGHYSIAFNCMDLILGKGFSKKLK